MSVNISKIGLTTLLLFLFSGCAQVEKIEHIEVFVTETSEENEEGMFVATGYKKVNAVTSIEEGKNYIKTDMKAIEDFYNNEGYYIKTEIIHSTFHKSNVTLEEDGVHNTVKIHEPSTILIPEEPSVPFQFDQMTEEEKKQVKEHVLSYMDKLDEQ